MSEPTDPFEARLRRLVADATADAPAAPTPGEMMQAARPAATDRHQPTRRWVAGGAIGLVAAAVIALLVVPREDDDALRPIDTVPVTSPATTIGTTGSTVPGSDVPEVVPPTTMSPMPTVETNASSVPDAVGEALPTTAPQNPSDPTVIAALDGNGRAVLVPTSGTPVQHVFGEPTESEPSPVEEGPGPVGITGVALAPDGMTAYVGLCCEPAAGVTLSGSPAGIPSDGSAPFEFGHAPAISPDGRLLALAQIVGPPVTVIEIGGDRGLAVPSLTDAVGEYTPYDTMWLDSNRLIGLGTMPTEGTSGWVAIPMVVEGDQVTVGETLYVNELLPADDDATPIVPPLVRFAGTVGDDRFAIHVPGEADAISIEFRLDGVIAADSVARSAGREGGAPARSIWYQPDGQAIWVGEDGVLHRGSETIEGTYLWARPTEALTISSELPERPDPLAAIDLEEASLFGYTYGTQVPADVAAGDVSRVLGAPTWDTGWQPNDIDQWPCNGDRFRTVWWGDIRITFDDQPELGERVAEWSVGDPDVYRQAPIGELPPATDPSGLSTDPGDVGVGSPRVDAVAAAGEVGRMVQDEGDQIFVTGAIVTGFLVEGGVVTGIGSGRLDCNVGDDL